MTLVAHRLVQGRTACLALVDGLMIPTRTPYLLQEVMIRGIHHVAVHVRDLERMIKFYKDAFGFEVVGEEFSWRDTPMLDQLLDVPGSAARGAMLRAGSCYMELFQFSAPQPVSTRPLRPFDKGYTHFCVDVTDIEQEYERLKTLGMTFGAPHPMDAGHVKSVYGRDPEGNVIEIQQTADHCDFRLDKLPEIPT
jgi:glyoxylase I family protein